MQYDLVVLAGGAARRMGGVDKVAVPLAGASSLDRVLASCADAAGVVVVGPRRATARAVTWCREEPPGGGPLAAVAAAVPYGQAPAVAVVAGDMPLAGAAVPVLLNALAARPDADAAVIVDGDGVRQPLAAVYRRDPLVRRLAALEVVTGRPAGLLLDGPGKIVEVPDDRATADCDTWADVHRIEEELRRAR
jgi:molybdopterin-guanine dinucleotide biosynthesis protein A